MNHAGVAALGEPSPADAQRFFDTAIETRGEGYLEHYWATAHQPHRHAIVSVLHTLPAVTSVLELGVMAGTNLKLIQDAFPWMALCGSDVHPQAVAFARRKLPQAHLYVAGPLEFLRAQPDGAVDVVFSCYTLAYLDRDGVVPVLVEMLRVARKGIIVAEPHVPSGTGLIRRDPMPEWTHDYAAVLHSHLMESKTRAGQVSSVPLAQPVDSCNGITTVRFTK